jgi:hypothetical protein
MFMQQQYKNTCRCKTSKLVTAAGLLLGRGSKAGRPRIAGRTIDAIQPAPDFERFAGGEFLRCADRGMVVQMHGFDHGLGVALRQDAYFIIFHASLQIPDGRFSLQFANLSRLKIVRFDDKREPRRHQAWNSCRLWITPQQISAMTMDSNREKAMRATRNTPRQHVGDVALQPHQLFVS